jgi:outer membrane protein insertion porin family
MVCLRSLCGLSQCQCQCQCQWAQYVRCTVCTLVFALIGLGTLGLMQMSWALPTFVIQDVQIEGLERVEPGVVFSVLPFRKGDSYTDEKGSAAIHALFLLGLFQDVRLDQKEATLVVKVQERPLINDITFLGVKEFEVDALKKALQQVGVAPGQPFDKALIDRVEEDIKKQYMSKSLYGAQVVLTTIPMERNRINLSIAVEEGDVAKIEDIQILGNQAFSEGHLKNLLTLSSTGWLSFYTKNDRYTRTQLSADLETLRSYYLARGYLEFKVQTALVTMSPDKRHMRVVIRLTEGQPYVVSSVRLAGDYLGKEELFLSRITVPVGKPYNAEEVAQTTKAFSELFARYGFAFARIEPQTDLDGAHGRVSLVLRADPSRRVYVRHINIGGNTRTRDEVIRREFRQMEASWYDGDRIRLSRDRVDRLGYFKDVNLGIQEVSGAPDQVDLNLNVEEKATGNFLLGAGFSTNEKLTFQLSLKEDNFLGSGNYLGFDLNTSRFNKVVSVSAVDPYFTPDGISRGVEVYQRSARPYTTQGGDYQMVTSGLALRFGVPYGELDRVNLGTGIEQIAIQSGTNIPAAYLAYADQFGISSRSYPLSVGWVQDSRDSALIPTRGKLQQVHTDTSLVGDVRYIRVSYQYQKYTPLNNRYSVNFNTEVNWGRGLYGQPYPIFKNFTAGGLGSVRGFQPGTLGPRDITGVFIGGPKKLVCNAEVLGPFPGAGTDRSLRIYGFYDMGQVYSDVQSYDLSSLRAAFGFGLSWISPMGPLRLSLAQPVRKYSGDRIQRLQFQIGTAF